MQGRYLSNMPIVKFLANFIDHINYLKDIKQLLLGARFIYTKQTTQVKMLQFLLRLPTLMWRLLLIFQILWSSKQSMKNRETNSYMDQN